jgi:hypothetical protein
MPRASEGGIPDPKSHGDQLEPLRQAIRGRYGAAARVENVVIPTLGGINRTLIFDLVEGAHASPSGVASGEPW